MEIYNKIDNELIRQIIYYQGVSIIFINGIQPFSQTDKTDTRFSLIKTMWFKIFLVMYHSIRCLFFSHHKSYSRYQTENTDLSAIARRYILIGPFLSLKKHYGILFTNLYLLLNDFLSEIVVEGIKKNLSILGIYDKFSVTKFLLSSI